MLNLFKKHAQPFRGLSKSILTTHNLTYLRAIRQTVSLPHQRHFEQYPRIVQLLRTLASFSQAVRAVNFKYTDARSSAVTQVP